VAYLDRLRELDVPERAIQMERDAWILVAAQIPAQMPALMALKRRAGPRRLLRLLEERGWTGWTKLERIRTPS
jgi:hypothetical protein